MFSALFGLPNPVVSLNPEASLQSTAGNKV